MYPLSDAGKLAFQTKPWQVNMTISPISGSVLTVTDANLVMGSLTVDRYVSTTDALPVGTATAAQLSFTLDNANHDFDGVVFAGAKINLEFSAVGDDNVTYTIPMGKFTVDEAPRILRTISVVALDYMCQFDIIPDITFSGKRVYQLVRECAEQALGAPHATVIYDDENLTSLPNANYQIIEAPEKANELTARQILQYCCQIMGVNAQIDREGKLYLAKYLATSLATYDETKRYSSDIREEISVTGVSVTSVNGDTNLTGTEGYVLEVKDNPLIQTDPSDIDLSYLTSITFCPYSAVVMPMPWAFPMDFMTFVKNEVNYPVYVTKMTQTVNANTAFEGVGLSAVRKGYATIDPLTAREQQILREIRTRSSEQVTLAEQNAINFSTIIGNALGLYNTTVEEDGATYYYFHDQETLEDSTIIYTFTAQGFGIATHWGGSHSDTTWQWGVSVMDASTSAIFTYLNAHQITADQIDTSTLNASMISITNGQFANANINDMINTQMADTITSAENSADTLASYANQLFIGDLHEILPSKYSAQTMGVAIGKTTNGNFIPSAIFAPSKLSFCDSGGHEVAWISSAQLHINDAEIMSSLKMGGYRWVIESDGEVILRWVGVSNG